MTGAGTAVRAPAVAGTFYPGDARALAADVDAHLAAAGPAPPGPAPKALIVPHAGYVYSGPVAGSGYARLGPAAGTIRRVVLLGPAHRVPVRSMAVPTVDAFLTPLGAVAIDDGARTVALALPGVVADDRPHRQEHSLEVHLPFLQRVLGTAGPDEGGWAVLPVVVGDAADEDVAGLLDALWGGEETLIVVSTDLSHYHDQRTAQHLDAATVAAMVADRAGDVSPTDACGAHPVRGLLVACRRRGLHPELLDRRTSADTAGDPARVVGYAALAVDEPRDPSAEPSRRRDAADLDEADRAAVLALARAGARAGARGTDPRAALAELELSPSLRRPAATFVTLRRPDGELRGCIGSIEAHRPLALDVAENAAAAATRDPRFAPVRADEVDHLDLHVAVLTDPRPIEATTWDELRGSLRPGTDGLLIAAGRHRATFLPAVWEQLPDPTDFLDHLWRKAGLTPRSWPRGLAVERYEAVDVG